MFGLGNKTKPVPAANQEASTSPIRKLVTQLMAEPFAESQHLGEATLDQLGRALEEAATDYERADLPPSLKEAAESFQRCKDLYCQLLLDLETLTGGDWDQKTLTELAEATIVEKPAPAEKAAPEGHEPPAEIPADIPMPDHPMDEPSIAIDFPALELPAVPQPDMIAEAEKKEKPEEEPEPFEPTLVTDLKAIPSAPEIPKNVKTELGFGQKAKELQLISEWLRSLAPKEPSSLDSPQINRLASQLLGAAMEIECWERMKEGTKKVWEKRDATIKRIFDTKKSPWCLPQATKEQLAQLEKSLVKGAPARTLPFFGMENSLRYLMTLPKLETFRLSLLDAGTYLFFFGQKRELREYQLENHFWTQEGKSAETAEAALRLIRFHEQHRVSLTPWAEEGEALSPESAEKAAQKILSLFDAVGLRRGR